MNAISWDTFLARRKLDRPRALASRPVLSMHATSGGDVRVRRQPAPTGPRLLFAADRTHRRSDPVTSQPSPELEAPEAFAQWLLTWFEEAP